MSGRSVILLKELPLIVLERDGSGVAVLRDVNRLDFRMRHIDTTFKHLGLAEDDIGGSKFIRLRDVFESLEPNEVDGSGAIGEIGDQTLCPALTNLIKTNNLTDKLDVRHIAVDFRDAVKFGAVDIFIRIIRKHIAHRCDVEFFLQQVSPVGADSLDEFYVLVEFYELLVFS